MADNPAVSIVMRSHNDAAFAGRTLEALRRQTFRDFELVVCDDSSTDGTHELLAAWPGVRMLDPEPGGYVPGKVLNRAVRACRGELVVFNNADAVILDDKWLERLIAPFADERVAAVFAHQHSRPDARLVVRKDYERAFGDGTLSATWRHFFSLASSAARRTLLQEQPFDESLQYSEDIEWSWRMRRLGWRIVYAADAHVEHSHNYPRRSLWRRFYQEGRADAAIFGTPMPYWRCWRQMMAETLRDWMYLARRGGWREIGFAPYYRYLQKYGYYCGLRDALKGQGQ